MRKYSLLLQLTMILSLNWFSSGETSPVIVAKVNQDAITLEELEARLKQTTGQSGASQEPELLKSQALSSLIVDKLVAQKAAAMDLKSDTTFQRLKQDHMLNYVFLQMYRKYVSSLITLTPEEIEKYYYENKETTYKTPEQVKVSHILLELEENPEIKDPDKRSKEAIQAVLKKAEEIKRRAKTEDFALLAKIFSRDYSTVPRGGNLGYQKRGQLLPQFDSAAFAAQPGDVIGPYQSQHGFHIIKVFDKVAEGYKTFDEKLQKEIEKKLRGEREMKRNQVFLDSLASLASYDFNDQILTPPETTKVEDTIWCLVVNKTDTVRAKDAREELYNYTLYNRTGQLTLEQKKDFFRTKSIWTQLKILQQVAKTLGYFDSPETHQEEKRFTLEQADSTIRAQAVPDYNPSPEEIQDYFESHPELYTMEFPLHVYHIIFDDSSTAIAVRDSILAGADFVEMARKHYPGETEFQEVAYDLGYISNYEMTEGFHEEANQLQVGEVSQPFKTFLGYHLIKLIDRKKDKTLQEVTPPITGILKEEYKKKSEAEWEANLKKGAKIRIYQEALDKVDLSKLGSDTTSPEPGIQ